MEALRQVVMVAAHFPPSNLAAVHRARLWAQHLPEFGWRPIVLTTHHDYYEERLDWDLAALVPESLEVVRTRALPVKPVRLIGDIGIRALPWHLAALKRLVGERGVDFVHTHDFHRLLAAVAAQQCHRGAEKHLICGLARFRIHHHRRFQPCG